MSDGSGFPEASAAGVPGGADSGTVETAKSEAGAVKDTAVHAAKDVAHTAKEEAASVAGEAKLQFKDLYAQSRTELTGQASQQQERLASGLSAAGDELGSMARNSENGGFATDLVQQASARLSDAAAWLNDRDPAAVLEEVKRFARRRPLVFIAGAAIAGIVAGRLVRSLAAAQHEDTPVNDANLSEPPRALHVASVPPAPVAPPLGTGSDSPLFDSTTRVIESEREVDGERPHTL